MPVAGGCLNQKRLVHCTYDRLWKLQHPVSQSLVFEWRSTEALARCGTYLLPMTVTILLHFRTYCTLWADSSA